MLLTISTTHQPATDLLMFLQSDYLCRRRFEWTRKEFQNWANGVCERFSYRVEFDNIGDVDENLGAPTQMATFKK
jgi:hypothetical protein